MGLDGAAEAASLFVTMGIALVSTDAFVLGVTAMPDPAVDTGYPWLFWKSVQLINQTAGQVADENSIGQSYRFTVDSKAMRKFKPQQTLAVVFQTGDVTPVDILQGFTRVLIGT